MNTKERILNFLFFAFPFLLYIGIASQGASYYSIGIAVPALFFIFNHQRLPSYFIKIGCAFIFLHIIFPLINFLIYFFPNAALDLSIYKLVWEWPGPLRSNFPSSLIFGGLAMILFARLSRRYDADRLSSRGEAIAETARSMLNFQPLKFFLYGLAISTVVFTLVMLYGHFTGLDFHTILRKKIEYMTTNDAFVTGGYRVYGFYGHPLTVAGVCLAYTVFGSILLWTSLANKNKFVPIYILTIITFGNEICLILSGGRTAAVVGIAFILAIPLFFNLRKNFFITLFSVVVIGIASFFMVKKLGILNRIEVTTAAIRKDDSFDEGNYRQYFWRTYIKMFADKPIVGQGSYWLNQGVLEAYYNKLGYEKLPEKFKAHNVYLETLGTVGLFGFLWIVIGLVYLFRTMKREIFDKKNYLQPFSLALIFAFVANLLHGLTQNVFFDSSVVYIYICLIVVLMWERTRVNPADDR